MGLSNLAAQVWTLCEQYIPLAMLHLSLGGPYDDESTRTRFDLRPESLRISFLFPGIAEKGGQVLLELRELRWRLACIERTDQIEQSIASAHSAEQVEAMFDEKRRLLEPHLSGLSEVQQEIVREYFFKPDLAK